MIASKRWPILKLDCRPGRPGPKLAPHATETDQVAVYMPSAYFHPAINWDAGRCFTQY